MYIASMTGFARKNSNYSAGKINYSWVWEIKSVNGKAFDLKAKLPAGFEALSMVLKAKAAEVLNRGNVSVFLDLSSEGEETKVKINESLMNELAAKAIDLYESNMGKLQKPSASDILSLKGVVETEDYTLDDREREQLQQVLLNSFVDVCALLKKDREAEGFKIAKILSGILDKIAEEVRKAEDIAAGLPDVLKQKLKNQIAAWLEPSEEISEERLVQEVVLLINRSDVREELDRLNAHIATAEDLLKNGGNIGRRLDFLCQELNREANTLCSKSADIELTNLGMNLKALIEQLREQVQNIE